MTDNVSPHAEGVRPSLCSSCDDTDARLFGCAFLALLILGSAAFFFFLGVLFGRALS